MRFEASRLPHVNLKLLHTFLLVGEHSSFRIAAEKSFRSASAVSAQIRQLETQLGVVLFHRTTRNVRLTAEGHELLACAERALLELDSGLRTIREAADIKQGRVSFSCSPTIAETRLAQVLAAFRQDYPGVEIRVRELTSEALFESIRQREADFGIGPQPETDEFDFDLILVDPLYALVPRSLVTTRRTTIGFATLASMPLLLLNQATALRHTVEAALKDRGGKLDTRYEFAQAQTLISMARSGLGAAILPRVALPEGDDSLTYRLRIVNPSLSRNIGIVTSRGQSLSPAPLRLIELIKQIIGERAQQI